MADIKRQLKESLNFLRTLRLLSPILPLRKYRRLRKKKYIVEVGY
jgi:hypothetical protein